MKVQRGRRGIAWGLEGVGDQRHTPVTLHPVPNVQETVLAPRPV